jgi:hypothetical protein
MNLRRLAVVAGLTGLVLGAAPAGAAERSPFQEFDAQLEQLLSPQAWLRGKVSEADVALVFAHIKASLFASAMGLPPPAIPDELRQRADELKLDLKAHGALAGLRLLNALEAGMKQVVRESLATPESPR